MSTTTSNKFMKMRLHQTEMYDTLYSLDYAEMLIFIPHPHRKTINSHMNSDAKKCKISCVCLK
jgi:hypothetical protein